MPVQFKILGELQILNWILILISEMYSYLRIPWCTPRSLSYTKEFRLFKFRSTSIWYTVIFLKVSFLLALHNPWVEDIGVTDTSALGVQQYCELTKFAQSFDKRWNFFTTSWRARLLQSCQLTAKLGTICEKTQGVLTYCFRKVSKQPCQQISNKRLFRFPLVRSNLYIS